MCGLPNLLILTNILIKAYQQTLAATPIASFNDFINGSASNSSMESFLNVGSFFSVGLAIDFAVLVINQ